ncbi:MAG TPA: hypothetical protein VE194_04865 [Rubrobacter sp.]|nr:hypothetical protein [Rubrobacter sp.]
MSKLASFLAPLRPFRGHGEPASRQLRLSSAPEEILPAICLLLTGLLLPQQEAYANPEYGFPLLAAAGAAGCIGYLLAAISRLQRTPFGTWEPLFGPSSVAASSGNCGGEGEGWPLLIALLFGSFLVLFSGLGGWVEANPRGGRPAALPA